MARNLPGFTTDLGSMNAPAAPNPAVLEASYAAQAKGIEIAGAKRAEAIGALAKLAETGYTYAVEKEAATAAQEVVNKLYVKDVYTGSRADAAIQAGAAASSELQLAQLADVGTEYASQEVVNEYTRRAKQIQENVSQETLSQDQARSILSSDMKRIIANNPMMGDRIRKVYNSYTGRGDWDVRPFEQAMAFKDKESEDAKRNDRMFEKLANEIYAIGGGRIGTGKSLTTIEILNELKSNTPLAREMNTKLTTHNIINHADGVMSKGVLAEFANAADAKMYASETQAADAAIKVLQSKGIDILNSNYVPSNSDRDALFSAVQQINTARMKSLSAAEIELQKRINENPNLDREQVATIRKQFADRKTPVTANLTEMLSILRTASADRNMDLQNHVKAQEAINLFTDNVFGKDFMARVKDVNTRQQMILQNPGNTAILAISKYYSERQSSPDTILELQRMMNIGAALTGSSNPVHQATLSSAEAQDVANVTQMILSEGSRFLSANKPLEVEAQGTVVVLGKNFVPEHASFASLRSSVLSKDWEKSMPDAGMREAFKRETLGRIGYFLNPANTNGYAATIASESAALGVTMAVESGMLVPKNIPEMTQQNSLSIGALRRATEKANSLLAMQDVLADRTDSATMLLPALASRPREVAASTPPIPVASPVISPLGDSNTASGTITSGDVLNPRPMRKPNPLATTGGAPAPLTEEQQRRQLAITGTMLPRTHDNYPAIVNSDGSVSTEISITVTDPQLNDGKPTNIPSLWKGRIVSQEEAIKNALASGNTYQSFSTIDAAVKAAKAKSAAGGANAPTTRSVVNTNAPRPWYDRKVQ